MLVDTDERWRLAARACAAGTLHVVLGFMGQVVVDHLRQVLDVDAAPLLCELRAEADEDRHRVAVRVLAMGAQRCLDLQGQVARRRDIRARGARRLPRSAE